MKSILRSSAPLRRALACLAVLMMTVSASAQQDPEILLDDFVHYTLTANPQLSEANARALLDMGLTNGELAELLDNSERVDLKRFDDAINWALKVPELQDIASEISGRIEQGRLDLARDPSRIKQAIEMLTGTQRQRLLARRRLETAGEYAVPQLLTAITDGHDQRLRNQCITVLEQIGAQAVTPLSTALLELGDTQSQILVCGMLGTIGHSHAGPALMELSQDNSAGVTARDAARRALGAIQRYADEPNELSALYAYLANRYFNEAESLVSFPNEPSNLVWNYNTMHGLAAMPVPTEIYSEVMAIRNAKRAMKINSSNAEALSLFVASNLRRENELPPGEVDPIYGDDRLTPEFYATVFGTRTCLNVLGKGLDTYDTSLVRDAIAALAKTTGGSNLFSKDDGRQPLLEALRYPDRRTQYDAALTLARALPTERFDGDFAVVPLLASAVRMGDRAFALVIADDEEDQRTIANMLEALDYEVAGVGADMADLSIAVAEAVGVDLVVMKKRSADAAIVLVAELRNQSKTAAAPVILQTEATQISRMISEFRGDRRVHVGRAGVAEIEFEAQTETAMLAGSGGRMTEAEGEAYAFEALEALRDIAISGSPAYDITEAESALIDSLELRSGGVRLFVGEILALIETDRAQRALFDAALGASDAEQVDLLNQVAASVRRFGDRAQQRQLDALLAMITSDVSSSDLAEAAARVHGAMNLNSAEAVDRIINR